MKKVDISGDWGVGQTKSLDNIVNKLQYLLITDEFIFYELYEGFDLESEYPTVSDFKNALDYEIGEFKLALDNRIFYDSGTTRSEQLLSRIIEKFENKLPLKSSYVEFYPIQLKYIKLVVDILKNFDLKIPKPIVFSGDLIPVRLADEKLNHFIRLFHFALVENGLLKDSFEKFERHFVANNVALEKLLWLGTEVQLVSLFNNLCNSFITTDEPYRMMKEHFLNKQGKPLNNKQLSVTNDKLVEGKWYRGEEQIDNVILKVSTPTN